MNRIKQAQLNHAPVITFLSRAQLTIIFDEALDVYKSSPEKETFGTMVQGFFGIKDGNNCKLLAFSWHNEKQQEKVKESFVKIKATQVGISFVKAYHHFGI